MEEFLNDLNQRNDINLSSIRSMSRRNLLNHGTVFRCREHSSFASHNLLTPCCCCCSSSSRIEKGLSESNTLLVKRGDCSIIKVLFLGVRFDMMVPQFRLINHLIMDGQRIVTSCEQFDEMKSIALDVNFIKVKEKNKEDNREIDKMKF
ncbi:hypothetical protein Leryth_006536 [Lithospermum erythrorhizon]|nr:hypothetical protein Leryth_006536 [Lithospermum erythrorhizon]